MGGFQQVFYMWLNVILSDVNGRCAMHATFVAGSP